ncbi:MAG: TonB-dependent receptor, partial [Muribaculaceae bacterium]|nr:TonB-dependent receptor [Muribaculaceae bacterium]
MKKHILRAVVLSIGATVPSAVAAQSAAASGRDNDTLAIMLRQVDVLANRATKKTPVAFTNVPKSVLTANNDGRDMTYLLSMTPSVTVSSDAGAGTGYTA